MFGHANNSVGIACPDAGTGAAINGLFICLITLGIMLAIDSGGAGLLGKAVEAGGDSGDITGSVFIAIGAEEFVCGIGDDEAGTV